MVIPIMHTVVDDLVRWLRARVLRRPLTEAIACVEADRNQPLPGEASGPDGCVSDRA
jgi:hypothetical protein